MALEPLIEIQDDIYSRENVTLDGRRFSDCVFRECRLIWNGGPCEIVPGCTFISCYVYPSLIAEAFRMRGVKGISG